MGLTIRTTDAQIGIDKVPGMIYMQTKNASLDIRQKQAQVKMKIELPKVEIDQYEAFASSGLKNTYDLGKELVMKAKQAVKKYISTKVKDGKILASMRGGAAIAAIAKKNSVTRHEFGYGVIPKAPPEITLIKRSIKFDPGNLNEAVQTHYNPGEVKITFVPGKVETYLRQKPSIEIQYIDERL